MFGILLSFFLDFGVGKSQALVGDVKLSIVVSNEDITKDPERADIRGKVNAHEATHTKGLATLRYLNMRYYC